jgi:hypothetical protein
MRIAGTIFGTTTGFAATLFLLAFLVAQGTADAFDVNTTGREWEGLLIFGTSAAFLLIASGAFSMEQPLLALACSVAAVVTFVLLGMEYTRVFYVFAAASLVVAFTMVYETIDIVDDLLTHARAANRSRE